MQEISTAREILPEGIKAALVFTRGKNFSLDDDGKGHTGYWRISPERDFETLVLYLREQSEAENMVYVADAAGYEGPNEEDRYLLKFVNATLVGQTASNWYEFTGMDTNNPVVYVDTAEEESMALAFDPDRLPEMISLVRERYPDWSGFDHPKFVADEIDYKRAASQKARELLGEQALQDLLDAGDYDEFIGRLETVGQSTNLLYLSHPRSGDLSVLYADNLDRAAFCEEMYALLHDPSPVRRRLERYFEYHRRHELPNKWTLPTYFLFMLYPDNEMFIKPMATRWFIELMNGPDSYLWTPGADAYISMRSVFHGLREALVDYGADDFIDVQAFLWPAYRLAQARDRPLAAPFDVLFGDHEQAERVLDFFAETAQKVGFEEHPDERFALTLQNDLLRLNFGNWMILDYSSSRQEFDLALLVDAVPHDYGFPTWRNFADSEREVAVHQIPADLVNEFPEEFQRAVEESLRYIRDRFSHWRGSPFRHAHQVLIFKALFDEEKRHEVLTSGLPESSPPVEETRYWRITLPTDMKIDLPDGTDLILNVWETCLRRGIAAIGFSGDKENFQVQKFTEIKPGDGVVAFLRDKTIGGVGRVTAGLDEKLFEERPPAADYFHDRLWFRIGVDWQPHALDVDTLPEAVANKFGQQTVLELPEDEFQSVVDRLQQPYGADDFLAETHLTPETMNELRDMLLEKQQLVLYGPPGTGKTYVAQRLARLLTGLADPPAQRLETVQFHPAYGYEDFIEGIRPRSKPVGDGRFMVNYPVEPGAFRRFCRAARDVDGPCVFIVDEINRGNIPRIFGELMLLLEYRDQQVTLPYSGESFSIPENVYIVGTMNTADRSIALVDFALRRRFHFFRFDADPDLFKRWAQRQPGLLGSLPYLPELYRRLSQQAIDDPNYAIGPSYFMDPDLTATKLEQIWRRSIIPYLEEYYFEQEASVTPWRWQSSEMRSIRMGEHLE